MIGLTSYTALVAVQVTVLRPGAATPRRVPIAAPPGDPQATVPVHYAPIRRKRVLHIATM